MLLQNLEMAAQSWVDAVKKAKKEAELASAANMLVEDSDLNAANEENNAELAMQHLTAVKQEASSAGMSRLYGQCGTFVGLLMWVGRRCTDGCSD